MARLVGIDIGGTHVRAVALRTSYRKVQIENLAEVDISTMANLREAIQAVALGMTQHGENIAVAVEGESAFTHRINLPKTAQKQLEEVLPYEIEAQVPVDIDELVYDYRAIHGAATVEHVVTLTAAVRQTKVEQLIAQIQDALGREPERVGCGAIPLANLTQVSAELAGPGPFALVDLGAARTELVIIERGEAAYTRSLSRGVAGLPDTAPALAAELRQTMAAWAATGSPMPEAIYLCGGGAHAPGAEAYLTSELGVRVAMLPGLTFDEQTADQAALVPQFAKAIGLALGMQPRAVDLNLRQGALSYQRGYGFLKEKVPLLSGLTAAIAISFAFASWAEYRALDREQSVLAAALSNLSKDVLGEATEDPARVEELLSTGGRKADADPLPRVDAFDAIVEFSKVVPMNVTHDIEEFDLHRGHVKIHGVAPSTEDAQAIASKMKGHRCVKQLKISKITKAINADRQKYVLEFDVECPEQAKKKKKKEGPKG